MILTEQQRLRFEAKYRVDGHTGCWLWQHAKTPWGYGHVTLNKRTVAAHRIAWELQHGPIPVGKILCHKCDVTSCVNPAHLFLGTHSDNTRDMFAKGRDNRARGERRGAAKLNAAQVIEIRHRYGSERGATHRSLAREYGVGRTTIQTIVDGRAWVHV